MGPDHGPLRVLVVDDDERICALVADILGATADVTSAGDPEEAVPKLGDRDAHFDLVVVDCMLPGPRGLEPRGVDLIAAIRARHPDVPIVAITGASLIETTTVAVWRNGAGALLRKPFRIDDFRASVTRLTVRASLTVKADPPLPASISRVLAFLADHCGETLRLETLSEVAGVSAWHLSRTFHHSVGVPMRTYIRDLRLDRAQEMLASSPRASLTDVALDAGFYDLPHFDKAFRARYGLSPSEFRRKALIS